MTPLVSPYRRISQGEAAGCYQAFPDVCRLHNGDLLCVFYAGYDHVSLPNREYRRGGRLCLVRSCNEGATWSSPRVLYDGPADDRDPHVASLHDGTVVCSFFTYRPTSEGLQLQTQLLFSHDNGYTWSSRPVTVARGYATSAPVREIGVGRCLLPVYTQQADDYSVAVVDSQDGGLHWQAPVTIARSNAQLPDPTEADIIRLKDGSLFAAIRSDKVNMHFSLSRDEGMTWTPAQDIGFAGHAPHLTRLSTGEILLAHRLPYTALHVSRDEARSWEGPFVLDEAVGAYPSTVELRDGSVLAVYYEEGSNSAVRCLRFRLQPRGIQVLQG